MADAPVSIELENDLVNVTLCEFNLDIHSSEVCDLVQYLCMSYMVKTVLTFLCIMNQVCGSKVIFYFNVNITCLVPRTLNLYYLYLSGCTAVFTLFIACLGCSSCWEAAGVLVVVRKQAQFLAPLGTGRITSDHQCVGVCVHATGVVVKRESCTPLSVSFCMDLV